MKKLFTGLLLASSFSVASAELVCGGTVDVLAYHANNKLMLKLSNMNVPVFFCSPDSEWVVARVGAIGRQQISGILPLIKLSGSFYV